LLVGCPNADSREPIAPYDKQTGRKIAPSADGFTLDFS